MGLTPEQAEAIKEHLLVQLSKFPEEKREIIKEKVESMTPEQVESFVEQNNLVHLGAKGNCIFCLIVNGESPSFKIAEDNENVAVLEINPLSKGHTLVIPKNHLGEISFSTKEFGKIVVDRLKSTFSPLEIKIGEKEIMGHAILEIIPIYGDETQRKPADVTELKKIQQEIRNPLKLENVEVKREEKVEDKEEIYRAKPRIPN
ncbi:MAG: HIT domain-containing protein [Candidatus Pacearchaeota archaeon]